MFDLSNIIGGGGAIDIHCLDHKPSRFEEVAVRTYPAADIES
jgi:hypothetical protein